MPRKILMKANYKYSIIISSIMVEEEKYNSYGIACAENGQVTKRVEDISVNEQEVEKLIKEFNKHKLDPIQLEDAVEDALS